MLFYDFFISITILLIFPVSCWTFCYCYRIISVFHLLDYVAWTCDSEFCFLVHGIFFWIFYFYWVCFLCCCLTCIFDVALSCCPYYVCYWNCRNSFLDWMMLWPISLVHTIVCWSCPRISSAPYFGVYIFSFDLNFLAICSMNDFMLSCVVDNNFVYCFLYCIYFSYFIIIERSEHHIGARFYIFWEVCADV